MAQSRTGWGYRCHTISRHAAISNGHGDCLLHNDSRYLIYAALELRCGVETRMQEYLHARDHIPEKQKNDWALDRLGKTIEKNFVLRDRFQEWKVLDMETGKEAAVLYYTPVTSSLRSNAAKLGNYLHSPNLPKERSLWWTECRVLLDEIAGRLQVATTGTLLGPAMFADGKTKIDMRSEVVPGLDVDCLGAVGKKMQVGIDYLDALPAVLPDTAIVWRPKN